MIALRLAHSNQYLSDFAVTYNYLSQRAVGDRKNHTRLAPGSLLSFVALRV
jgi:hypothetical protein